MASDDDIAVSVTGFSTGEIDVILSAAADPDEEVVPAIRSKPRTNPGDVWQLGPHRVDCGDGRDRAFLREVVGEAVEIDSAFLDPP